VCAAGEFAALGDGDGGGQLRVRGWTVHSSRH
jgi:hypothetical protein